MEHISNKPVSKETFDYVNWLISFMWSQCIDTKTREILKQERERLKKLHT